MSSLRLMPMKLESACEGSKGNNVALGEATMVWRED